MHIRAAITEVRGTEDSNTILTMYVSMGGA